MEIPHDTLRNLVTLAAELFASIFRHLKLELLTQFPASNDEKYWIIGLTKHLPNTILSNLVIFLLI